jgi:lysophospholipase L1-like esterase
MPFSLNRREFVATPALALAAGPAEPPLAALREHWTIRTAVIALQRSSLDPHPVAIVGDSRIEGMIVEPPAQNWGFAGAGIADVVAPIRQLTIGFNLTPRAIFSFVGINTVFGHLTSSARDRWGALKDDLDALVAAYKALAPRVVLATVPGYEAGFKAPVTTAMAISAVPLVTELNAAIRACASQHGFEIVEVAEALTGADGTLKRGMTLDGIHFAAAAVDIIRQKLTD